MLKAYGKAIVKQMRHFSPQATPALRTHQDNHKLYERNDNMVPASRSYFPSRTAVPRSASCLINSLVLSTKPLFRFEVNREFKIPSNFLRLTLQASCHVTVIKFSEGTLAVKIKTQVTNSPTPTAYANRTPPLANL